MEFETAVKAYFYDLNRTLKKYTLRNRFYDKFLFLNYTYIILLHLKCVHSVLTMYYDFDLFLFLVGQPA